MEYLWDAKELENMTCEQIESVLKAVRTCTDEYLYIWDLENDSFSISESAAERFNLPGGKFLKVLDTFKNTVYESDLKGLEQELEQIFKGELDYHNMEYRWYGRKRQIIWISCRGTVVRAKDGHPRLMVGRMCELGEKQTADNVTGLRRETQFERDLNRALSSQPESIGYCMRIGIDNFKEINEKNGLEMGDGVLKELAGCITAQAGQGVKVYRIISDEFMVFDMNGGDGRKAEEMYHGVKHRITERLKEQNYEIVYTISAGLLEAEYITRDYNEVAKYTEFALNEAKRCGRNQMVVFDAGKYSQYVKTLDIRKYLRLDIANDFSGFDVFFQPIVDGNTYGIIGAEALLRWNSKEYGRLSPVEFIPILEDSGLIIPVGRWVIKKAMRAYIAWREKIPGFHINVNLSYIQVLKSDIIEDIMQCIYEEGAGCRGIVLELTESGYIETDARFHKLFNELNDSEIQVALDDFGTGYSNLRYLREIKANILKLDRSFVIKALENQFDFELIGYIVQMAHSIGMRVCMEGVEKLEEVEALKSLNPDYLQGFYFGRPVCEAEFTEKFVH